MSQIVTALIAGIVAVVVSLLGARWDNRRQTNQLKSDLELQQLRIKEELRTEYMAEAAIHELLIKAEPKRSFARIQARVGGFEENELRRLLVRAGALRYQASDGTELWGLRDRNEP
jgi:hypothetical protein